MLITTDLHLTDRERDEYRWKIFPWLAKKLKELGEDELYILGDLTDAKDGHSAKLVNRIIDTLMDLPASVRVLMGNHDYMDEACPFFRFLSYVNWDSRLTFFHEPKWMYSWLDKEKHKADISRSILLLPHTRNPVEKWDKLDLRGVRMIFCHQTYNGANAGSHRLTAGISANYWSERGFKGPVISGDIHVQQKCGDVEYVGCPYPIAFGDSFEPRVLQVIEQQDGYVLNSIEVPSIKRWSLDIHDVEELDQMIDLNSGDQLKVRVHLPREEFGAWEKHRDRLLEITKARGVEVFSIELREKKSRTRTRLMDPLAKAPLDSTPADVLREFCRSRGLDESLENVGLDLLGSLGRGSA